MKQNETVKRGSILSTKEAETLENSRSFGSPYKRALEDSNPRPFGP